MTFTNRLGQDIFIKLNSEDEPKVLRAFDSRISFVYRKTGGTDKLQVSELYTKLLVLIRFHICEYEGNYMFY